MEPFISLKNLVLSKKKTCEVPTEIPGSKIQQKAFGSPQQWLCEFNKGQGAIRAEMC